MQERKEIEKQIEVCEKKKLWMEYDELRNKVMEYMKDKGEAEKVVKTHQTKLRPLETKLEKERNSINNLEQQKLAAVGLYVITMTM